MKKIIVGFLVLFLFTGCRSMDNVDGRPPRTTSEIRLDDIYRHIQDNPVYALNLVYMYKEIYSAPDNIQESYVEEWIQIDRFRAEAIENLIALQEKAIEEERWEDAISFGRSLASVGVITDHSESEAVFVLADAKKRLAENDILGAFLSAVRAHHLNPLDQQSALLFLEKAVEVRQRRAAAFFHDALVFAGGFNINPALAEYALGRDSVSDMVRGVATVIVDRGFRVERGMGFPDRVLGSAFFIDSSGLMITNYHVISSEVDPRHRGVSRVFIRMGDASSPRIPARVIGWDKTLDLAVIRAEVRPDYVFSVVDRVIPRIGDTVIAIGSPIGLEQTVTSGIVSALGRRFLQIGNVYQIDASVNQGNSGGPVIDSEGRLVGVVFAGIPQFQGLNFAVPADMLAAALPAMLRGGRAPRPWLGLVLCETFSGTEIIYTAPNTPAFRHRVNERTHIKSINGNTVTAPQGGIIPIWQRELFTLNPNELVSLETINNEGIVQRHVMMSVARPDVPMLEASRIDRRERLTAPLFGMFLVPLQSNLFVTNFRVDGVVRGSIADEVGISENDRLSISRFRILEEQGFALLEISISKRRMGFLETNMQLPAWLDSPDTL
ncbi:MAG: S1C family serine protease [Treponema sp.]|nr:S1C family serine protease [Treponema sp.]